MKKIRQTLRKMFGKAEQKRKVFTIAEDDELDAMRHKVYMAAIMYIKKKNGPLECDAIIPIEVALYDAPYTMTTVTSFGWIYEVSNLSEEERYSLKYKTK
jgi:hypothetical protein